MFVYYRLIYRDLKSNQQKENRGIEENSNLCRGDTSSSCDN